MNTAYTHQFDINERALTLATCQHVLTYLNLSDVEHILNTAAKFREFLEEPPKSR